MVKKEISSDEIWKKAYWELLSGLLIHLTELNLYFVDLFASLISVDLKTYISDPLEGYRAKGNILR